MLNGKVYKFVVLQCVKCTRIAARSRSKQRTTVTSAKQCSTTHIDVVYKLLFCYQHISYSSQQQSILQLQISNPVCPDDDAYASINCH